jgi:hypothetical protein
VRPQNDAGCDWDIAVMVSKNLRTRSCLVHLVGRSKSSIGLNG